MSVVKSNMTETFISHAKFRKLLFDKMKKLTEMTETFIMLVEFRQLFFDKMKKLAEEHSTDKERYYTVIQHDKNPTLSIGKPGCTVLGNKVFKATSEYELYLKINVYIDVFWYDDLQYLEDMFHEKLGKDVTLEDKLNYLVEYEIKRFEDKESYDLFWIEVEID